MTILLLGASGRLGSAIMRLHDNYKYVFPNMKELDLTKKDQVLSFVDNLVECDLIINCAAYNDVDKAENEGQDLAFLLNTQVVGYLAEAAKQKKVPLIHFSTDYVFSGNKEGFYVEKDLPDPISVYGESKALGEKLALETWEKTYVVRTSRLFGPKGTAKESKRSFVELVLDLAKENSYFSMNSFEIGSPTYVNDLAKHVFANFIEAENIPEPGIFHATNTGWCTFYEWAHFILEAINSSSIVVPRDIRIEPDTRPAKRPKCAILASNKIPKMRDWKEALQDDLKTL